MTWRTNVGMEWWDTRVYSGHSSPSWVKISDHNRAELEVSVERIENESRMTDGTYRRYTVGKKRSWSTSWSFFPSKSVPLLVNGQSGEWMEQFHADTDGSFLMRLRKGADDGKATTDSSIEEVTVVISDFSKTIVKRGKNTDLWSLDLTLKEV
jgi:hypothetical protein